MKFVVAASRRGIFAVFCTVLLFSSQIAAQPTYRSGQLIEPAYEGWRENPDGTFSFIFGYMNENWEEEPKIPVGENNMFSPGDPDRGQPTHFLPRRNRFTFEVVVPADWGDRELVWTLISANGIERKAYATLAPDYVIDNVVIASETGSLGAGSSSPESRANKPPEITLVGDRIRTVRVGEVLTIQSRLVDDGVPRRNDPLSSVRSATTVEDVLARYQRRIMQRPSRITVNKINGLYLSWNVYRGEGEVMFDPPQVKPWEDTRAASNSPWGDLWVPPTIPEDGIVTVDVQFDQPGDYILWARADDGGLYSDQYLEVSVTP
ncbi:MAG: hypothetical protein WD772_03735 [Pseudohongiellaceae bacterium]